MPNKSINKLIWQIFFSLPKKATDNNWSVWWKLFFSPFFSETRNQRSFIGLNMNSWWYFMIKFTFPTIHLDLCSYDYIINACEYKSTHFKFLLQFDKVIKGNLLLSWWKRIEKLNGKLKDDYYGDDEKKSFFSCFPKTNTNVRLLQHFHSKFHSWKLATIFNFAIKFETFLSIFNLNPMKISKSPFFCFSLFMCVHCMYIYFNLR